jgi:hypothetical protein
MTVNLDELEDILVSLWQCKMILTNELTIVEVFLRFRSP